MPAPSLLPRPPVEEAIDVALPIIRPRAERLIERITRRFTANPLWGRPLHCPFVLATPDSAAA